MPPDLSADELPKAAVVEAVAGLHEHRAALVAERGRLDSRDRAIADAVRAGARLEEIAEAASVTRAAASLAARRTLSARPRRGGPYARRRSSTAALQAVSEAADRLSGARHRSAETRAHRDEAIVAAVNAGAGVRATARALGMNAGAVSTIVRAGQASASTGDAGGAVASRR